MESKLYKIIKNTHSDLYSKVSHAYADRTENAYGKYLQPFVDSFLNSLEGASVLDLGCGPGRDLSYFQEKGLEAVGADLAEGMVKICKDKGLYIIHTDFFNLPFNLQSFDGIWAYTSLTLLPKEEFIKMIEIISNLLKPKNGTFAVGMIEGDFEGWKIDVKYPDTKRYVLRLNSRELEEILLKYFDTVALQRVADPDNTNRYYLHAICRKIDVKIMPDQAAMQLFNKYSDVYESRTQTGIELLKEDRSVFESLLPKGSKILDLGAGPGRDSKLFKEIGFNPIAFDISDSNILQCQKKGVETVLGDMTKVGQHFKVSTFNGVWANCSLTNWIPKRDIKNIIEQLVSITEPQGIVFIGSVIGNFQGWEVDEKYGGLPRFNVHWDESELKDTLKLLGEVVYEKRISAEESHRKSYLNLIYRLKK